MPLHYMVTLQQKREQGREIGSIAALEFGPCAWTVQGDVKPVKDTTRQAIFHDVLAYVRCISAIPDDTDAAVLHWSLT